MKSILLLLIFSVSVLALDVRANEYSFEGNTTFNPVFLLSGLLKVHRRPALSSFF